jgi:hypothetical protein
VKFEIKSHQIIWILLLSPVLAWVSLFVFGTAMYYWLYIPRPFETDGFKGVFRGAMTIHLRAHPEELLGLTRKQVLEKLGKPTCSKDHAVGRFDADLTDSDPELVKTAEYLNYVDYLWEYQPLALRFDKAGDEGRVIEVI